MKLTMKIIVAITTLLSINAFAQLENIASAVKRSTIGVKKSLGISSKPQNKSAKPKPQDKPTTQPQSKPTIESHEAGYVPQQGQSQGPRPNQSTTPQIDPRYTGNRGFDGSQQTYPANVTRTSNDDIRF